MVVGGGVDGRVGKVGRDLPVSRRLQSPASRR